MWIQVEVQACLPVSVPVCLLLLSPALDQVRTQAAPLSETSTDSPRPSGVPTSSPSRSQESSVVQVVAQACLPVLDPVCPLLLGSAVDQLGTLQLAQLVAPTSCPVVYQGPPTLY